MARNDDRGDARVRAPTLGVVAAAVVLGWVPFLITTAGLPMRVLRGALWLLAAATLLYLAVVAWRIYVTRGAGAALRWVLTGSVPRR